MQFRAVPSTSLNYVQILEVALVFYAYQLVTYYTFCSFCYYLIPFSLFSRLASSFVRGEEKVSQIESDSIK